MPERGERDEERRIRRAGVDAAEDEAGDDRRRPHAAPRPQRREEVAAEEELLGERGEHADEQRDGDERDVAVLGAELLRQRLVGVVRADQRDPDRRERGRTRRAAAAIQPTAGQNAVGRSPKSHGRGVAAMRAMRIAAPIRHRSWTTVARMFTAGGGIVERGAERRRRRGR